FLRGGPLRGRRGRGRRRLRRAQQRIRRPGHWTRRSRRRPGRRVEIGRGWSLGTFRDGCVGGEGDYAPDVFTRRITYRRVCVTSQSHGCRTLAWGVPLDPRVPVVPPAALIVDRVREPRQRISTADVTRAMAGSRATRSSGDRDGVSAVCEYECHVAADHRDCPKAVLPRGDVIGRRGKDVGI